MIFLNKSLHAYSVACGQGRKPKWYHRINLRLSTLGWISWDYWFKVRPLLKEIARMERKLGL